jgi:aspartyl-tRNA synthetase
MEIMDISDIVAHCGFKVFSGTVESGGVVKILKVEGVSDWPRSELDKLEELAKTYGAKGLAYFVYRAEGIKSPIIKFLDEETINKISEAAGAKTGDIVFFAADKFDTACIVLGQVRLYCGKKLGIIDENVFAYLWVNQFPMFEFEKETGQIAAMHHPFTRPMDEDRDLLDTEPVKARAVAYDIILNGSEIGGGSIRIHEQKLQQQIFDILKISPADAERRFGHMLEAFSYGAPPHGGIAWGLDRLIMLFAGEPNIREVIAFPKDQKAKDLTLGAPSEVAEKDIKEANIQIINLKK